MAVIFHLAPREYFEAQDAHRPYTPEGFAQDGFIHCTEGIDNVVEVGNRYYGGDLREYLLLLIDPLRVAPDIRYEDDGRIYPHIYGPLNRDAIVRIIPMPRSPEGAFLEPSVDPS